MTAPWTFEDIVDLDHFATLDQLSDRHHDTDLHERDRGIYLAGTGDGAPPADAHRRCLRLWLNWQREQAGIQRQPLPGRLLGRHLGLFRLAMLLGGLAAGFLLGGSYFAYSGTTPLNVFTFFTLFILPQLLLIVLLLTRAALSSSLLSLAPRPGRLSRAAFARFLRLMGRFQGGKSTSEEDLGVAAGLLSSGNLPLRWPLFVQGQLFGLAFNCGLLLVTLFKVATADLAFGWQTTLQFGPEALSRLVQTLSSPWTWLLGEGFAAPSPDQIEGSRIILKDGIEHLLTDDLTSWWPFLLMSLIFYGFLPRAALLGLGLLKKGRTVRGFLEQRRFRMISRRMQLPLLSTRGEEQPAAESRASTAPSRPAEVPGIAADAGAPIILIPVDIAGSGLSDAIASLPALQGGGPLEQRIIFRDYEEDMQTVAALRGTEEPVIVLLEAWMAPIGEQLDFLADLSASLAASAPLSVCLLGRPGATRLTPPKEQDRRLWRRRIDSRCEGVTYLEPAPAEESEDA